MENDLNAVNSRVVILETNYKAISKKTDKNAERLDNFMTTTEQNSKVTSRWIIGLILGGVLAIFGGAWSTRAHITSEINSMQKSIYEQQLEFYKKQYQSSARKRQYQHEKILKKSQSLHKQEVDIWKTRYQLVTKGDGKEGKGSN